MNDGMVIIKDIAAILGLIVTLSGVFSIFSKSVRSFWAKVFSVYGDGKQIKELKEYVDQNLKTIQENKNKEFQSVNQAIEELTNLVKDLGNKQEEQLKVYENKMGFLENSMNINTEFVRTQCRSIVKNMFYKYCKEQKLPLYEFKTLLKIEELYVEKCNGNSFAQGLITRMKTWEIDDSNSIEED